MRVLRLEIIVGIERRGSEQHRNIQPFALHRFHLRDRIIAPSRPFRVIFGDFFFALLDTFASGSKHRSIAEIKLDTAMLFGPFAARNPVAPLFVHVGQIEIRRIVDMHVAV